ncbi:hypothetical protein [Magnetospirillum aberrantis]|uniref:DUF2167 domain-containing protein n=1 Tax=Magnetospirillum aberrantis SpK TaxID=908842 RepID=A0A7C9QUT4_9PROT|nr:hypothetical protein [Magnetospirillum aberrantis]NFV80659.1 hypothetical protein [Magnetospirillum aberrantis SpK]
MASIKTALAASVLASLLWCAPALAAQSSAPATAMAPTAAGDEPLDLIMDRPSTVSTFLGTVGSALGWAWDKTTDAISVILPPSPISLAKSVDSDDQAELVTLLSYAGYKLKEIDSQVGVIPTIAFKFALTRELSEADWDYLDYRLEVSRFRTPGLGAALQRAIVGTVMSINTGGAYQVSELKIQALPLPKVAFSVTPKQTALGEESSALLRAIQKTERRLRGDLASIAGKILPGAKLYRLYKARDGIIVSAIALFVVAILVELRRNLRSPARGRAGRAIPLGLLGLGTLAWVVAALAPLSLLTLSGGIAVFGVTALLVAAKGPQAPANTAADTTPDAPEAPPEPTTAPAVAVHVTVETDAKAAVPA